MDFIDKKINIALLLIVILVFKNNPEVDFLSIVYLTLNPIFAAFRIRIHVGYYIEHYVTRGIVFGDRRGCGPSNFFKIDGCSEILIFDRKIFGNLLLMKIKALNFIEKSLNLALLLYIFHDAPECYTASFALNYYY